MLKIHPDGNIFLTIQQRITENTENSEKSQNNENQDEPSTPESHAELIAYSCVENSLQAAFPNPKFCQIDKISYAANGIFSLLTSFAKNRWLVFNLKKGKIVATYQSDSKIVYPIFDSSSQNVLFGEENRIRIFSLKFNRVVEDLEIPGLAQKTKQNQPEIKFVFENPNGGKILVFSKNRLFEMVEDNGEDGGENEEKE